MASKGYSVYSLLSTPMWMGSCWVMILVRYTMDRPRFFDHLEAIKFICKDFWSELFKKQIDNLKTNHRVCFIPPIVHLGSYCERWIWWLYNFYFCFFCRVHLYCRIISFVGFHAFQGIHQLSLLVKLRILLPCQKTKQHKQLGCIFTSLVDL